MIALLQILKQRHFWLQFLWTLSGIMTMTSSPLAFANNEAPAFQLECKAGVEVRGPADGWSQVSTCPQGTIAVGIAKLDLLGDHNVVTLHINDLRCEDQGCKVYCIGAPCQLQSRCCQVRQPK